MRVLLYLRQALCLSVLFIQSGHASSVSGQSSVTLSLPETIQLAIEKDVWHAMSRAQEQALQQAAKGMTALPDPTFSLSAVNVPVNGYTLDQEPMTQIKVGLIQQLPRGDSLSLSEKRYLQMAAEQPVLRTERKAKAKLVITRLWSDAVAAKASMQLINDSKVIVAELQQLLASQYRTQVNAIDQTQLIHAELELAKLEDKYLAYAAQYESASARLTEWLQDSVNLPSALPEVMPLSATLERQLQHADSLILAGLVSEHPTITALQQQVKASETAIEIARQEYKPLWQMHASYGYRQDDQFGESRADFLSVGVNVQFPLFSDKRPSSLVSSAVQTSSAKRTETRLLVRQLSAQLADAYSQHQRLAQRYQLYHREILAQLKKQTDAALNVYARGTGQGNLIDVVRLRLSELETRLTMVNIRVEQLKNRALLGYLSGGVL